MICIFVRKENMLRYIDTHVHLYDEAFDPDREVVIERIKAAGVWKCLLPAIDSTYYERQTQFADCNIGFAYEAMGLHPTSVSTNWKEELLFVRDKLYGGERRYYAVGEIGLDCYWSKEFIELQKEVFLKQLLYAYDLSLPVIIHVREATAEIFDVLDKFIAEAGLQAGETRLKGVFHAYSGSIETFERLSSYGDFRVGIGGVVTYKNAGVAKALENIDMEHILLETDSPWLTPVPFRGKRNESSYLSYIAQKVASIKNSSPEEVANITTENAQKLFNIS